MVSLAGERDAAVFAPAGVRESGGFGVRRVAVGLFGLALVVRLGALIRTDVIFNDGPVFLQIAAQMQAGQWHTAFAHDQHPGYPLWVRSGFPEPR